MQRLLRSGGHLARSNLKNLLLFGFFKYSQILWRNFNFVLKTYFRRQNLSFSLNCLHVGVDRGSGWLNSSDDKSSRNLSGYFDLYSDILGSLNVKLYLSEFESTGIVTELDVEVSLL